VSLLREWRQCLHNVTTVHNRIIRRARKLTEFAVNDKVTDADLRHLAKL